MRSAYYDKDNIAVILSLLTPSNALALEVSLYTGLRITDVLNLKTSVISERFTVQEQKTGKRRVVRLSRSLVDRCVKAGGSVFVFPNRLNGRKPRTRQAVFKDLKRACGLLRVRENLTPHSMRKIYAVEEYKKYGSIAKVMKLLNHDNEAVTMLYCMADQLKERMGKK